MVMLYRLVRLIETHSEELKERVYDIYRHLGDWLITKDELDLEQRCLAIGARRALQSVPLSQVAWVITLTKENLWEFIKKEITIERPVEVFGELEMLQMLDYFFDRAIYYAAIGYERMVAEDAIAGINQATG